MNWLKLSDAVLIDEEIFVTVRPIQPGRGDTNRGGLRQIDRYWDEERQKSKE